MQAVYAFKPGFACKRYFYDFANPNDIACWMRGQGTCNRIEERGWQNNEESQTDACTTMEDNYEDTWKCSKKIFSVNANKIHLAPAPPCGWVVAVHWQGIKRNWADADLVPDDQDLKNAVALWVEYQDALRANCDARVAQDRLQAFNDASQDIWYRCRREAYVRDLDSCMSDVALFWDSTYVDDEDIVDGSTTTTTTSSTTSSSTTTSSTTTQEGDGTTTDEGEFTTNPVDFCITEFECLGTSGAEAEGDVAGEFGEFEYEGARASTFTAGQEECDYKFRFVIDFGEGGRLDALEIRITEADGTETNQNWATANTGSYPLVVYASPLNLPGGPLVTDYIVAPFTNANSFGEFTGEVEFFAYGQIYIPANQTTSQHFRLTATVSEVVADPGEEAISNTLIVYELATCSEACTSPRFLFIGADPECDFDCCDDGPPCVAQFNINDDGGTIAGPTSSNCNRVWQSFNLETLQLVCGQTYYIIGSGLTTFPGPVVANNFPFVARPGMFIGFCPTETANNWTVRVIDPGQLCEDEAATQEPVGPSNLPSAPQCANTGPHIESAEWECVEGGWELVSVTLVAGTLVNLVPPLGTIFPENADAIVLAEIEIGGQSFEDSITYYLGECATATTPE
jgi:hypothetical protein